MAQNYFTSESVTEGHPDKVCDQISDAVLDEVLEQDPDARVAIETFTKTGLVVVGGELSTEAYVNIQDIVRDTLQKIGYDDGKKGIDGDSCGVLTCVEEQSQDIQQGVDKEGDQGAGDQGIMFGYATDKTDALLPLPIVLSHKLTKKLSRVRKQGVIDYLRPDGKSQVTVKYENGKPQGISAIVLSAQHDSDITQNTLKKDLKKNVIQPVMSKYDWDDADIYINPTGRFVKGGPEADAGLTGRKIIVDTYGGMARHGGGAFSGKDPSKVDRSASYMARYIAKNIVAAGLADTCEIQLSYAIGRSNPISVKVDTFDTANVAEDELSKAVMDLFPLKPKEMIEYLDLKKPVYSSTATYGHFGNEDYTWEKTNMVNALKNYFS